MKSAIVRSADNQIQVDDQPMTGIAEQAERWVDAAAGRQRFSHTISQGTFRSTGAESANSNCVILQLANNLKLGQMACYADAHTYRGVAQNGGIFG